MEDNWLDSKLSFSGDLFLDDGSRQPQMAITTPSAQFFDLSTSFYDAVVPSADVPSPAGPVTTYRMRGYFVGGSTYEFWNTTDPTAANPSGNPLVNKVIDSILSCS